MMKLKRFNQRGDTLVEVTMALAIMALVLTGAFVAANRAYLLGQQAKERSQIVSVAQQQAEALESFRDSHSWYEFRMGNGALNGIRTRTAASNEFHMVQTSAGSEWTPVAGRGSDGGVLSNLSSIWITIDNDPGVAPNPVPASYKFVVHYSVPTRGGGPALTGTLWLILANTDLLR